MGRRGRLTCHRRELENMALVVQKLKGRKKMKSLTFNRNSWHYKIAYHIAGYRSWHGSDICTYTRYVMGALFVIFIGVALGLCVLYVLFQTLIGIVFSLMTWTWMFTELGFLGLIVLSVLSMIFSVIYIKKKIEDKNREVNRIPKPDGFVKNAYKSWKEKYCVRIKFTE